MTKIKGETPTEEVLSPQEKFDTYIAELKTKRTQVAEEHEAYLKAHPPKGIGPHGSTEVYGLSQKILAVVEVGKKLGLVGEDVDPYSFL